MDFRLWIPCILFVWWEVDSYCEASSKYKILIKRILFFCLCEIITKLYICWFGRSGRQRSWLAWFPSFRIASYNSQEFYCTFEFPHPVACFELYSDWKEKFPASKLISNLINDPFFLLANCFAKFWLVKFEIIQSGKLMNSSLIPLKVKVCLNFADR